MTKLATSPVVLAVLLSCGQENVRTKTEQPAVRTVALPAGVVDLDDWSAWSISGDGQTIAVAPQFGVPGGLVVDVATGATEPREGSVLVEADRPLFWRPVEGVFWDESAQAAFSLAPPQDEFVSLRNTGTGVLARLAHAGGRLTLQTWSHQESISWTKEIVPAPDSAGVVLSPSGDLLVFVQSNIGGAIHVTGYEAKDGTERWTRELPLRSTVVTMFVRQPVYVSDDGASVWVAGTRGSREPLEYVLTELSARDGSPGRTVGVDKLSASTDNHYASAGISSQNLWVATVSYFPGSAEGGAQSRWVADYSLYDLSREKPRFDPVGDVKRVAAIYGEAADVDQTARAFRPLSNGGAILVQVRGAALQVTTWSASPGAPRR